MKKCSWKGYSMYLEGGQEDEREKILDDSDTA